MQVLTLVYAAWNDLECRSWQKLSVAGKDARVRLTTLDCQVLKVLLAGEDDFLAGNQRKIRDLDELIARRK